MSKKNRNRNVQVNIRMTENEKKYIQQKAEYCNKSFSDYCRETLISGVVIKQDTKPVIEVLTELSRIGNNVNQIAKSIHIRGEYATDDDLNFLRKQFDEMRSIIIENIYHQTYDLNARLNNERYHLAELYIEDDVDEADLESYDIDFDEEMENIEYEYHLDNLPEQSEEDDDIPEEYKKLFEEFGD